MQDYLGKDTFKLGFGLMRLPRLENGEIDVEQFKKMVDLFLEAGGTYFDTAFAYGGSEEATKKALVERVPRDKYTLATKLIANGENLSEETLKANSPPVWNAPARAISTIISCTRCSGATTRTMKNTTSGISSGR